MSTNTKKPFRKRHLFARNVSDVVKEATKPLMTKQGKLYSALLRDWPQIVGPARAAVTKPERLQFPTSVEASGAILHLATTRAVAPELTYETEAMLEQCACYFGYRAITRIVIHASMVQESSPEDTRSPVLEKVRTVTEIPSHIPPEMRAAFTRIANHIASHSDKEK